MSSGSMGLFLILAACLVGSAAEAREPRRVGQQDFLTRAIFADGRLWLLSDAGELSTITEGKDTRVEEKLAEPVHDLCLRDGRPFVVTCSSKACASWTLRRWDGRSWSVDSRVKRLRSEEMVALSCKIG